MIRSRSSRSALAALVGGATLFATSHASAGNVCSPPSCSAPTLQGQTTGSGDRNSTQIYGGIQWTFGAGPELVLGVRASNTKADKKSAGAKLEATFPFSAQSISFDKLRLRLFGGTRTLLPELGVGYSFASAGWLLSGAVQIDHLVVGTDYAFNGAQWQPFVGLNSLSRPKAPKAGSTQSLACESGQLTSVSSLQADNIFPAAEVQLDGFTCSSLPQIL